MYKSGTRWIVNSTSEYLFLSLISTTEKIPNNGWKYSNDSVWRNDDETLMIRGFDPTICLKIFTNSINNRGRTNNNPTLRQWTIIREIS